MSFQDFLASVKNSTNELKDKALKFKNKDIMSAAVATSALVSAADGSIDSDEKQKMMAFIEHYDPLQVYNKVDVVTKFKEYCDLLDLDKDIFDASCMDAITKIKGNEQAIRFVIRMGIAIGGSDGTFDDAEKAVIRNICLSTGVSPQEFQL